MTNVALYTNFVYDTEVSDVVKLFFDTITMTTKDTAAIVHEITVDTHIINTCTYGDIVERVIVSNCKDRLNSVRLQKRYAKIAVYNVLVKIVGVTQPWGCLTGIRPTKLAYQIMQEGDNYQTVFEKMFGVDEHKVAFIDGIISQQNGLRTIDGGQADMYIAVPFCKTRCSYCSFTSGEISQLRKYVDSYVDALIEDITFSQLLAKKCGLQFRNLYIGGGTPTTLSAAQLDRIMSAVAFAPQEYCVEAGRPDTIDIDQLNIFKQHNVNRISINPQTFEDSVLANIGRTHSSRDVEDCYQLARQYGFDINMDFIAGLPTDSFQGFRRSIDKAIQLSPDNITVHTLALKQGSLLAQQSRQKVDSVAQMVDYAYQELTTNGYSPYYLYRQKYMSSNLENVGYCKVGKQCRYNINIMEETSNIIACGANAISKRVFASEGRIERSANAKDVITYINNLDVYLTKKENLFH